MQRTVWLILVCVSVLATNAWCQTKTKPPIRPKTGTATTPKPETDVFSVIKKVVDVANDATKGALSLTDYTLPVTYKENEAFQTTLQPKESFKTELVRELAIEQNYQVLVLWKWSTVMSLSLTDKPDKLSSLQSKLEAQLNSVYSKKSGYWNVNDTWISINYNQGQELVVSITFRKPLEQNTAATKEALLRMFNIAFSSASSEQAIADAGLDHIKKLITNLADVNTATTEFAKVFPAIADRNINAAFTILMDMPSRVDAKKLTEVLTSSQRETIQKLAQKAVDEYYNKQKKDPVTTGKTDEDRKKEEDGKARNEAEFKKFMESFPTLSLPYTLTPGKLVGSKMISRLPWMKKIYSSIGNDLYAVGIIKDCGNKKTLLLVQISTAQFDRSYIFTVLEINNGYFARHTQFTNGVFFESGGSFCGSCSLKISAEGLVTVTTSQNGRTMTATASSCF